LENSVFDRAIAARLAAQSYRTSAPGPWVEKVVELLEGLWWAESGHFKNSLVDDGLRIGRPMLARFKEKDGFAVKVSSALTAWNKLSADEQQYFGELLKSTGEIGDSNEIAQRVSQMLNACEFAAKLIVGVETAVRRGPIPQLHGLTAFVERIEIVWKRSNLSEAFSAEFGTRYDTDGSRYAVSSAAKLVCNAAKMLDARYTVKTCEAVMRPR
jgi:hypothetical protein